MILSIGRLLARRASGLLVPDARAAAKLASRRRFLQALGALPIAGLAGGPVAFLLPMGRAAAATLLKPSYGTSSAVTITAGTLGSGLARAITAIDNTSNLAYDYQFTFSIGAGTVAAPKAINFWGTYSEDGTNYLSGSATTDVYAGSDASVTLGSPSVFRGPFQIPTATSSITYVCVIPSFLALCGLRVCPRKVAIVVDNQTGAAFTSCSGTATPLQYTNVELRRRFQDELRLSYAA